MVLHARISPGGWTVGPLVVAVQRRLTPSTYHHQVTRVGKASPVAPSCPSGPDCTVLQLDDLRDALFGIQSTREHLTSRYFSVNCQKFYL
jgi:hypothetical protein